MVHSYLFTLQADDAEFLQERAPLYLNSAEQARAQRFRFDQDRWVYMAGRYLVKTRLAHYFDLPVQAIELALSAKGKPSFSQTDKCLHFNIAHSQHCILVGFFDGAELGLDLEKHKIEPSILGLGPRVLHPSELNLWSQQSLEEQYRQFFEFWVCKEALVKMTGKGISSGLSQLKVDLNKPELLEPRMDHSLMFLACPKGFSAAISVAHSGLLSSQVQHQLLASLSEWSYHLDG